LALKTIGCIISIPVMALLFIFLHDLIIQWDHFNAKTIRIAGNRHLTEKQVLELAGIRKGQNILSVNIGLSRKRLISHGWIADAAVSRRLPDGLGIEIREHEPAAVIATGPGYIMDHRGIVFKKVKPGEADNLLVVSGLAYTDITAADQPETPAMKAVVELLEMDRRSVAVVLGKRLKKIQVDRETGLTLTMSGHLETVKIGYDRYSEKLRMLNIIRQFAERSETFAAIESIDLNDTNRIVLGPVTPDRLLVNNKEV
jgi:cell division protein FtsQ